MKTFLFERYGYYPKELNDLEFEENNFKFRLIRINFDESYVDEVFNYVDIINKYFNNKGAYLIKNRLGSKISYLDDKKYVLVSIYKENKCLKDLYNFHKLFFSEKDYIKLEDILLAFKERVENIENNLSSYISDASIYYKDNINIVMYCIGLAINGMQYLSDIIYNYDGKLYGVSVVHKRLKDLNSFDFFNPFNFIIDSPIKDLVLLYEYGYLDYKEFLDNLLKYKIDEKIASYVLVRVMYRIDVFDFVESNIKDKKIPFNIKTENLKLKNIYKFLKKEFNIRPIDWLEE